MRNALNYSRMLCVLFAATTFVAAIGSVGAQTSPAKNGKEAPKPATKSAPPAAKSAPPATKATQAVKVVPVKSAPAVVTTPAAKPAEKAAAPATKTPITESKTVLPKATNKPRSGRSTAGTTASTPRRGLQRLVPPPPPSIPLATLSPSGGAGNIPPNLQYLKKDELVQLSVKLKEQCTRAKQRFDDHEKRVKAQQDKIALYEKLLSEGVVSRRDLENAKNELDDLESRTSDLEEQVLQLTGDLAVMRKYLPAQKPH